MRASPGRPAGRRGPSPAPAPRRPMSPLPRRCCGRWTRRPLAEIRNALTGAARPRAANSACVAGAARASARARDADVAGAIGKGPGSQVSLDIAAPGATLPGNTVEPLRDRTIRLRAFATRLARTQTKRHAGAHRPGRPADGADHAAAASVHRRAARDGDRPRRRADHRRDHHRGQQLPVAAEVAPVFATGDPVTRLSAAADPTAMRSASVCRCRARTA